MSGQSQEQDLLTEPQWEEFQRLVEGSGFTMQNIFLAQNTDDRMDMVRRAQERFPE